jgi:hypothetical protein
MMGAIDFSPDRKKEKKLSKFLKSTIADVCAT